MKITNISNIEIGTEVKIQGFVENIRNKNNIAFLVIKDITGKLQITILKKETDKFNSLLETLTIQSVVSITGIVKIAEAVKLGGKEMMPTEIVIESLAATPLPVDELSLIEQKLDYRWLDLRTDKNQLMFKMQTCLTHAFRSYLIENNFMEMHSPKMIKTASETGSEVFTVDYFDTKAYLAQSPQFYKQMAIAGGWERVFECGPVFRAEKSHTNKHATEFTGFDLEFTGVESVEDVMKMEENLIVSGIRAVANKFGKEINETFGELAVPTKPFPRMDLKEVYKELEERYGYKVSPSEVGDLPTEGEKLCKQLAKDKFNHEFIFITGFDTNLRAFYHFRNEEGIAQGYDLIWRGVEITTGAKREHRYEQLVANAKEKGLEKDTQFYLEFFKYGCAPHGGFGIGLDRITMLICNTSIKETEFVFRGPDRLNP